MPVNKDELVKDLATPEYQDIVKTTLTAQKFSVLTEAEKTTMLDNHKKEVIEKEIPVEIEKVHTQYDNDFKTILGDDYKRNANEKTYEAFKRVGKAKLDGLSKKIVDLEEDIKKGDPTGAIAKRLTDAEDTYKKALEARDNEIKELKVGTESANKSVAFERVYSGVKSKFTKQLPAMFAQSEKRINADIIASAILKDGVLYVGDGQGMIKRDGSFKEITVESALELEYKDVIDTRKKQGGSGSGINTPPDDNSIDPTTITKDNFEMPGNIKEPGDLMEHLMEIGVPRGTKQFNEIWNKYVDARISKLRPGVK